MRGGVAWWCGCVVIAVSGCALERISVQGGTGRDAGPRLDGGDAATDAGPRCVVGGCDDGNSCTNDTCDPATGCVFAPVPGSCDDGVLCNGADSCGGGTCSVHDGVDPCPGGSTCDEPTDTCTGCETDLDCPGEMFGDFGACEHDPADPCVTEGTRSRIVRSYSCVADGTCERSERTDTEACSRTTDGASCGDVIVGDWSACTYGDACSDTGTRSRSVSTPVCMSGGCQMIMILETDTAGCARPTEGMSCGDVVRDDWGPCGGFSGTCGESGTQTRVVRTPTCQSGACVTSSTDETRSCTRVTDGDVCDVATCSGWSACVSSSSCSGSGNRYRICDAPRCADGSCSASARAVESESCTSGSGSSCVDGSLSCGDCHLPGSTSCPDGSRGVRDCDYMRGTCNPGNQCLGAVAATVTLPCACD